MNFKRSTTSMAIALMALSLISMTSIQQDAFAQQSQGMSIMATADKGSTTITVTGETVSDLTDVTFRVTSPSMTVVEIGQLSPGVDGKFVKEFKVGPTWTEDGLYKITVMQGIGNNSLYTLNVLVEVVNGMTERTSTTQSNMEGVFTVPQNNAATDAGLMLDAIVVENGSTMFEVTGLTDRVSDDITVKVTSPDGNNVVTIKQVSPNLDGEFATDIKVGGPMWKQNGFYTVYVQQGDNPNYSASTEVDILDGVVVPEFGTIAAMILAVAIISIIAISAKSRLSIIPRY